MPEAGPVNGKAGANGEIKPNGKARGNGRNGAAAPAAALPYYASRGAARFLLHYAARRFWSHFFVLLAVLAAVGCAIGSQYGVKDLVDTLDAGPGSPSGVIGAVGVLLLLVAGDNLLWRVGGWIASYAFVAVGGDMRLDLFDHLSGHGSRYFSDRFPGALAARITTTANAAWTIENSLTWTTFPPAAAVLSSVAVLGLIDIRMTMVLSGVVLVLGLWIGWLAARGQGLHEHFAGRAAAVSGDLTDVISNMGLVRAFGAAPRERARLSSGLAREMTAQRKSLQSIERLRLLHAFAVFIVTAGVLVWAVILWSMGAVTTGDVVLATTLGFTMLHASRDLAMALVELTQHFAKMKEAVQVLGLPHEMADVPDALPIAVRGGAIRFEDVSFRYPNGDRVLQGFNLEIPAGQKVGLVGRSGAGKSTILALVQRLYDPERGHIRIDGQDIAQVQQDSLRHAIAVVQQDISLFHRSVLENLRYGRPDASDDDVYSAADAARCTEFIDQLPEGFDTLVGERGLKLSGGQRQRLAIARAFLRNAPVVLLDEASSALDTESEQSIQEALHRLVKGRTVIAIAHRLSTLGSFNRIIVLDRGRIIEDGTSDQLLRQGGLYSRMYYGQFAVAERERA
jgi:ATP-binding cassette subfamily B protein